MLHNAAVICNVRPKLSGHINHINIRLAIFLIKSSDRFEKKVFQFLSLSYFG